MHLMHFGPFGLRKSVFDEKANYISIYHNYEKKYKIC